MVGLQHTYGKCVKVMNAKKETDDSTAILTELTRAGIDALLKALGPLGLARFLQELGRGKGDYTAEREDTVGSQTVDDVMDDLERRKANSQNT